MNAWVWFWFVVAAAAAAAPIPLIKLWTTTRNIQWILLSAISYSALIYAYSVILADKNITVVYPVLKVLSVFIVIAAGVVVFRNKLDTTSIVGILLGLASIYLLSSKLDSK
jgi:multidrug transporter EmrE-like cation transporter